MVIMLSTAVEYIGVVKGRWTITTKGIGYVSELDCQHLHTHFAALFSPLSYD